MSGRFLHVVSISVFALRSCKKFENTGTKFQHGLSTMVYFLHVFRPIASSVHHMERVISDSSQTCVQTCPTFISFDSIVTFLMWCGSKRCLYFLIISSNWSSNITPFLVQLYYICNLLLSH